MSATGSEPESNRYAAGTFAMKASYVAQAGDYLGTPNYMMFASNGWLIVVSGGYNRFLEFDMSGGGSACRARSPLSLCSTLKTSDSLQNGNLFVTGGYAGGVMAPTGAFVGDFVPKDAVLDLLDVSEHL